jgi:hypothetical protein
MRTVLRSTLSEVLNVETLSMPLMTPDEKRRKLKMLPAPKPDDRVLEIPLRAKRFAADLRSLADSIECGAVSDAAVTWLDPEELIQGDFLAPEGSLRVLGLATYLMDHIVTFIKSSK